MLTARPSRQLPKLIVSLLEMGAPVPAPGLHAKLLQAKMYALERPLTIELIESLLRWLVPLRERAAAVGTGRRQIVVIGVHPADDGLRGLRVPGHPGCAASRAAAPNPSAFSLLLLLAVPTQRAFACSPLAAHPHPHARLRLVSLCLAPLALGAGDQDEIVPGQRDQIVEESFSYLSEAAYRIGQSARDVAEAQPFLPSNITTSTHRVVVLVLSGLRYDAFWAPARARASRGCSSRSWATARRSASSRPRSSPSRAQLMALLMGLRPEIHGLLGVKGAEYSSLFSVASGSASATSSARRGLSTSCARAHAAQR